jgi:hypothetical protein
MQIHMPAIWSPIQVVNFITCGCEIYIQITDMSDTSITVIYNAILTVLVHVLYKCTKYIIKTMPNLDREMAILIRQNCHNKKVFGKTCLKITFVGTNQRLKMPSFWQMWNKDNEYMSLAILKKKSIAISLSRLGIVFIMYFVWCHITLKTKGILKIYHIVQNIYPMIDWLIFGVLTPLSAIFQNVK